MEYANGRMTAGVPSLLPQRRRRLDTVCRTRDTDRRNLRQKIERERITTAPDGGRPVTSIEAQLGRPMTSQQVSQKLSRLNSNLHFERSLSDPTKMGIYLLGETKRFICGMEFGFMPEFSVRHSEQIEVPSPSLDGTKEKVDRIVRETRGWRTVLARLVRAGIIRLAEAEKAFAFSRDSKNWKELTT